MANNKLQKIRAEHAKLREEYGVEVVTRIPENAILFEERFKGLYLSYATMVHIGLKSQDWFRRYYGVNVDAEFRNRALDMYARFGMLDVSEAARIQNLCDKMKEYSGGLQKWGCLYASLFAHAGKKIYLSNVKTPVLIVEISPVLSYILTPQEYFMYVHNYPKTELGREEAAMVGRILMTLECKELLS